MDGRSLLLGNSNWVIADRTARLRNRLDEFGNVFEFVTSVLDQSISMDAPGHKRALLELYQQIMSSQREWHSKVVRELPAADYPEPSIYWNLGDAVGEVLNRQQITNLLRTSDDDTLRPTLYGDFVRPLCLPMGANRAGQAQALFGEWIDAIGLADQDDIQVLNWVNQSLMKAQQGNAGTLLWTDFFGPDPLFSHAWCLTVWNPLRRTISALAACSTIRG